VQQNRRITAVVAGSIVAVVAAPSARAAPTVYEPFAQVPGDSSGSTPSGFGVSGFTGGGPFDVVAEGLSYPGLATTGGKARSTAFGGTNVNLSAPQSTAGTTTYVSFPFSSNPNDRNEVGFAGGQNFGFPEYFSLGNSGTSYKILGGDLNGFQNTTTGPDTYNGEVSLLVLSGADFYGPFPGNQTGPQRFLRRRR